MLKQDFEEFVSKGTESKMKLIEEEIFNEVSNKICEYFGTRDITDLTEKQLAQIETAENKKHRGFLKLGYKLIIRQCKREGLKKTFR